MVRWVSRRSLGFGGGYRSGRACQVKCDPNGKPMPWLWVVLLPFIDEERLLRHLQPLYSQFTPEERERCATAFPASPLVASHPVRALRSLPGSCPSAESCLEEGGQELAGGMSRCP